ALQLADIVAAVGAYGDTRRDRLGRHHVIEGAERMPGIGTSGKRFEIGRGGQLIRKNGEDLDISSIVDAEEISPRSIRYEGRVPRARHDVEWIGFGCLAFVAIVRRFECEKSRYQRAVAFRASVQGLTRIRERILTGAGDDPHGATSDRAD